TIPPSSPRARSRRWLKRFSPPCARRGSETAVRSGAAPVVQVGSRSMLQWGRAARHHDHHHRDRRGVWQRRLASGAIVGVLALCVVGALAAWRLSRVAKSLSAATATLKRVDPHLRPGDFAAVDTDLQTAEPALVHANNVLRSSPELSVGSVVPVLHQNIAAVRRSVSLALRLVDG